MVCRNESIDESNAELARDLRLLVRERLVAGDSDAEVVDYVVDRYGEYVLLRPTAEGGNLILWVAGPVMLLLGGGIAALTLRRRRSSGPPAPLSVSEQARLDELLKR
jgi:cytochrome c-type biogenesis protein CcmH